MASNTRLIIKIPGERDREIKLCNEVSIGRAFDNSICLDNPSVSRYHTLIEQRGDNFWISDLGSVNATLLNGDKISGQKKLLDNDKISIGVCDLAFHQDTAKLLQ